MLLRRPIFVSSNNQWQCSQALEQMQELGESSLSLIPSCRTLPGQPSIPVLARLSHSKGEESSCFHEIIGCLSATGWAIHMGHRYAPKDRHLRQIALIITRRLRLRIRMPKVSIRIYSLDTLAPNSAFALDPDVLHVSALFFTGALLALPCNVM